MKTLSFSPYVYRKENGEEARISLRSNVALSWLQTSPTLPVPVIC